MIYKEVNTTCNLGQEVGKVLTTRFYRLLFYAIFILKTAHLVICKIVCTMQYYCVLVCLTRKSCVYINFQL